MNLENVQYKDVKAGDTLFVSKKALKVVEAGPLPNGNDQGEGVCTKVVFENGDEYFGWATRTLKKVV